MIDQEQTKQVQCQVCPADKWFDNYQKYYICGLREYVHVKNGNYREISAIRFPELMRCKQSFRDSSLFDGTIGRSRCLTGVFDKLAMLLAGQPRTISGYFQSLVGQYTFVNEAGEQVKFCIDSHDSGEIVSPELLLWADVYFKSNYWVSKTYDDKVVPIVNGNPLVVKKQGQLRSLREEKKDFDICFVVRVWGGNDEISGVEHVVRLLEAVAKVPGRHLLIAYLVVGDIPALKERLTQAGVTCITKPMPLEELWAFAARSRINVLRLGMHLCIPWRMVDMLALGSAIVLDQNPYTRWPQPLVEGVHYFSLADENPPVSTNPSEDFYAAVSQKLVKLLADGQRLNALGQAARDYFDNFACPEKVGEYVISTVERHVGSSC